MFFFYDRTLQSLGSQWNVVGKIFDSNFLSLSWNLQKRQVCNNVELCTFCSCVCFQHQENWNHWNEKPNDIEGESVRWDEFFFIVFCGKWFSNKPNFKVLHVDIISNKYDRLQL